MKYLLLRILPLLAVCLASPLSADTTTVATTTTPPIKVPYIVVTPQHPVEQQDVSLQVVLGNASNSCFAPKYYNCKFRIVESPLAIYPPLFTVFVTYTETSITDVICPDVYNPVDYGPVYQLGKLKVGSYQVVDDNSDAAVSAQRTFGNFTVDKQGSVTGYQISGTVHDDPSPLKRASMPVEKAKLYLYNDLIVYDGVDTIENRIVDQRTRIIDSTMTDATGAFSFKRASAANYSITCSHPDFQSQRMSIYLRKDTTISFSLISVNAAASVSGTVSLGNNISAEVKPFPQCTLSLNNFDPRLSSSPVAPYQLRTFTDGNGRYTFDKVPIKSNGETWYLEARSGIYSELRTIQLSNGQNVTANFVFRPLYENRDSVVSSNVTFIAATDKFSYKIGEPVNVRYTLVNNTKSDAKFGPFSGLCEYDLIITDISSTKPVEIYRASAQTACLDNIVNLTVPAGSSLVKSFPAWYYNNITPLPITTGDVPDAAGLVVARPMKFKVAARLQGKNYDYTEVGVTIEIVPVPVGVKQPSAIKTSPYSNVQLTGGTLIMTVQNSQNIQFNAYRLNGSRIPDLSSNHFVKAGTSSLMLRQLFTHNGYAILEIKGSDFTRRFSTITLPR